MMLSVIDVNNCSIVVWALVVESRKNSQSSQYSFLDCSLRPTFRQVHGRACSGDTTSSNYYLMGSSGTPDMLQGFNTAEVRVYLGFHISYL